MTNERALAYLCAECGGFAYTSADSLDSGTMLTCDKCGGKTVVLLLTTAQYRECVVPKGGHDGHVGIEK